ncbi:FixH family protein [Stieleria sp. ICT_E10.1]|uniref:FixH family protein n=1 Tax=Stieleria sedimenti TaxID=2976331 RepID=UPI00217FAC0A|nr:FixH family protein [Stieleria sedimenti]MCS7465431.1 FixH family protein [Stieleria sedimenti]
MHMIYGRPQGSLDLPTRPSVGAMILTLFLLSMASAIIGCGGTGTESAGTSGRVVVELDPEEPSMGECNLTIKLFDAEDNPINNAELTVEGNMNHAGMKPSFATIEETDQPGVYSGTIDFTMGGDWFLLVTALVGDRTLVEQTIDVPGVSVE